MRNILSRFMDRQRQRFPKNGFRTDLGKNFLKISLERNGTRPKAQRIPVKGILATSYKIRPPSYDEGFDELYRVRVDAQGLFQDEEWSDISR
ncbi:MAG: hypothetical protein ACXVAB_10675 [Thermodesulfobacteriota bacterium]